MKNKKKKQSNTPRQIGLPLPPEEIAKLEEELVQVVLDAKKVKAEFKEISSEYKDRHKALLNRAEAVAQELREQEIIKEDRETVEIITEAGPLSPKIKALPDPNDGIPDQIESDEATQ